MSESENRYLVKCKDCGKHFKAHDKRCRVCLDCKREKLTKKKQPTVYSCKKCGKPVIGRDFKGMAMKSRPDFMFCRDCVDDKRFREMVLQAKGFRAKDLEEVHGIPKCPDCGLLLLRKSGRWFCSNDVCSVIDVDVAGKDLMKITRDSCMVNSEIVGA